MSFLMNRRVLKDIISDLNNFMEKFFGQPKWFFYGITGFKKQ